MTLPEKTREIQFQLLYAQDFSEDEGEERMGVLMRELKVSRRHVRDAYARMMLVWGMREELDREIGESSDDYSFERISRVERNLLRMGLFELKKGEIPGKVALSEMIRLCRKFGTPESADFVNAVLDRVYKKVLRGLQHELPEGALSS